MNRELRRTVVIVVWSMPLALAAAVVGANVALAAALARLLGGAGLAPGVGFAGIGFWALFFGSLALANLPALGAFAGWARAEEREQALRAEVLSAVRWPARLDRWRPQLWTGVPAPGVRRPAPSPLRRHAPYAARFVLALAAPVALLGLLAAG